MMERHPITLTAKLVEVPSTTTQKASWRATIVVGCDLLGPGQDEVPVVAEHDFATREEALRAAIAHIARQLAP